MMMKIYGQDNSELIQITSLKREGGTLVMKGKVFGAIDGAAHASGGAQRSPLLNFRLAAFLLTFLFRR